MLFKKCFRVKDILVYFFLINVLYPGVSAQFRSDYIYSGRTDAFYKFHIESASNARASDVCKAEGSRLMVVTSQHDMEVAHGMLKQFPDLDGYAWISTDGQHHDSVEDDYGWERTGPKCTVMARYGEAATALCFTSHPFICKTDAREVQYDARCKVYVKGYQYFENLKSCYKIPRFAASWNEAFSYCQAEGAHLVVLNSGTEQQVVRNLTDTARVVGSKVPWFFYVGVRAEKQANGSTAVFKTIFDQYLAQSGFDEWCPGEPNNKDGDQYCGTLLKTNGKYNDEECTKALGFICEKEV